MRVARERGEIDATLDPERAAFELDAALVGADVNFVLFDDPTYLERGRATVRRVLGLDAERGA